MSMKLPAEPKPENVVVVVDTREQLPFDLSPMQSVVGTLATGDYSVVGLTHCVALERKSLDDFLACVGTERERFDREVQRLLAYETRAIIVESSWGELEIGGWRSRVTSAAAIGSALGWIARGVPVVMAGGRQRAQDFARRILFLAAKRRWREARELIGAVQGGPANNGS